MTVDAVFDNYGTKSAKCDWFEGAKSHNAVFPVTSLKIDE